MPFTLDAQVGAVLAVAIEQNRPPPAPPAGDVESRPVPSRPVQQPLPVRPRIQAHRSNLPAAARDYRDGHAVLTATDNWMHNGSK